MLCPSKGVGQGLASASKKLICGMSGSKNINHTQNSLIARSFHLQREIKNSWQFSTAKFINNSVRSIKFNNILTNKIFILINITKTNDFATFYMVTLISSEIVLRNT